MAFFGKKSEGGVLDVIRCDEDQYLVWKWKPNSGASATRKENAIRWGSSLRVKDGEVAVFVYKGESGPIQDFIEGPFDETLKTANFPVLASIIGLAFDGASPFQAEVYFINLSGNIKREFRVPYFDVADPRFTDFPLPVAAGGSYTFNVTDYKSFIKLHRLIQFDMDQFAEGVRDAVIKYVKGTIVNVPIDNGIPVLQIERKLLEINDLIAPRIRKAFEEDFGVNLKRFDLSTIAIDKKRPEYDELRAVTAHLETQMRTRQNDVNMLNLEQTQEMNATNMGESLRIQREQAERFAKLQTESQFIGAHQINKQADVLMTAASNLGEMGQMNLGGSGGTGGGGGGGGFNPIGVMTGLAVGGAMGGQMANMMNATGQNIQAAGMAPPPLPQISYLVAVNGQSTGPFSMPQLQAMAMAGQLTRAMHVWKQGMANWEAAGDVAELATVFVQPTPPPPPPPPPPAG